MSINLPSTILFAAMNAALLAFVGAIFGVAMARLIWADDLKHAIEIDSIRSKTEVALRTSIKALEDRIEIISHRVP